MSVILIRLSENNSDKIRKLSFEYDISSTSIMNAIVNYYFENDLITTIIEKSQTKIKDKPKTKPTSKK